MNRTRAADVIIQALLAAVRAPSSAQQVDADINHRISESPSTRSVRRMGRSMLVYLSFLGLAADLRRDPLFDAVLDSAVDSDLESDLAVDLSA